jgi:ParB/RepB/Spo0J family partition protein
MGNDHYIQAPLSQIAESWAQLRIIYPQAEKAMERSMRVYGQMTPVVICRKTASTYEMIDGFKRLRAGRKLGYTTLEAKIYPGGRRACKAAIIHLNTKARTIADLETGMVIRSLCRQDALSQVQVAALLGRHKSFVCRRLQLVEKLSEAVLDHLKLGLINITTARELARLPSGNQQKALSTIIKHRFTSAEAGRLVSLLLSQPRWNHDSICYLPEPILADRQPDPPPAKTHLYARLLKMEVYLTSVSDQVIKKSRHDALIATIKRVEKALSVIQKRLVQ